MAQKLIWEKNTEKNMIEYNLSEEKRKIRKQILKRRNELSTEERKRAGILMTERILGHQWYYGSDLKDVAYFFVKPLYEKILASASTGEIIQEALRHGKRVYLPRVMEKETEHKEPYMEFFRVYNMEELISGYRGIPEPSAESERFIYCREEATNVLMLMPGVAFDRYRNRIGYGKGFYDRYLQDKEGLQLRTIGVGFQCQLVEKLPCDERDIRPYQVICV